jgi:raffinose/stachyose/melibiose transport system permease protein
MGKLPTTARSSSSPRMPRGRPVSSVPTTSRSTGAPAGSPSHSSRLAIASSGTGRTGAAMSRAVVNRRSREEAPIASVNSLTAFIVVVQNAMGLALALAVHSRIKSRNVLRVFFFAPAVLSPVVIAFLWKYMLNPEPDAGLNAMLGFLGLDFLQQTWLGDPSVALWAIGLTVVWQFAGFSMVIFLAALQGIPRELEEAAAIDGASRFQRFHRIVLPLIAPAMTINLTLSTIGGLKLFDQVFAITNGGPGYSTETLSMLIYKQAFVFGSYGYSTAVALVLTLLVAGLALLQVRYLQSREVTY